MSDNESNVEKLAGYAVSGLRFAVSGAKLYITWLAIISLTLFVIAATVATTQHTPDIYGANRYTPYHGFSTTPGAGNFKP